MKNEKTLPRPASTRIDGGKRIDLKAKREKRGISLSPVPYPQRDPKADARKRRDETRRSALLSAMDGGKDGAVATTVKVRDVQGERVRTLTQTVRSRPGTFEWRYGRDKAGPLFHAGSHFARLWERAGIAVASSADFLRGISSGYATGVSDTRVVAMKEVGAAVKELGRRPTERLVDYCVLGLTTSDLARKHGQNDRDMAAVIHQDLRTCAMHFRYL